MGAIHRRQFLATCGSGALGLAGLHVGAAPAHATNLRYTMSSGFNARQAQIVYQAMRGVAATLPNGGRNAFAMQQRYMFDGSYAQAIDLPWRADWWSACMRLQIEYYLRRQIPLLHFDAIYERSNYWGRAEIGLVRTLGIARQTGRMSGQFVIALNRYWLGNGREGSHPALWSGLIVHEMMHNLGHLHGDNEYGLHLQINAVAHGIARAAVRLNLAGTRGLTSDTIASDEDFGGSLRFCGH